MKHLVASLLLLCGTAFADFQAGKDFRILARDLPPVTGPIEVIEFFSYSCHWCQHFEPALQHWLARKPNDVTFKRIHVLFQSSDSTLAKSYYIAKFFNVEKAVNPLLFKAGQQNYTQRPNLMRLFAGQGISQQALDDAFHYSPSIDRQIGQGQDLVQRYHIYGTPALLIARRFLVDSGMANGDNQRFINILKYLLQQARQPLPQAP